MNNRRVGRKQVIKIREAMLQEARNCVFMQTSYIAVDNVTPASSSHLDGIYK